VCETFRPFASAIFVVCSSSLRDSVPATILDQDIFGEEWLLEDWSLEEERRLVSFVFEGLPTAPTEASLQFYMVAKLRLRIYGQHEETWRLPVRQQY
jgi:hypothetical protein